jgi:hypothetical protein
VPLQLIQRACKAFHLAKKSEKMLLKNNYSPEEFYNYNREAVYAKLSTVPLQLIQRACKTFHLAKKNEKKTIFLQRFSQLQYKRVAVFAQISSVPLPLIQRGCKTFHLANKCEKKTIILQRFLQLQKGSGMSNCAPCRCTDPCVRARLYTWEKE